METRSDPPGRATFDVSRGGDWLIAAVHMVPAAPETGATWESFWASLTFHRPPGLHASDPGSTPIYETPNQTRARSSRSLESGPPRM